MLQEIASIGELLSGVGVILSLIFVGYQIRQNSALLRRAANRETITALRDTFGTVVENAQLADILDRFDESYENLERQEKRRAGLFYTLFFQQFELITEDHKIGNYDDEPYEYFARAVARHCCTPGGKQWWRDTKSIFTPTAQNAVEDAIRKYGDSHI